MKVEVKDKLIPTSFLKIEGKGMFVGAEEGQLVKLGGDQNPSPICIVLLRQADWKKVSLLATNFTMAVNGLKAAPCKHSNFVTAYIVLKLVS